MQVRIGPVRLNYNLASKHYWRRINGRLFVTKSAMTLDSKDQRWAATEYKGWHRATFRECYVARTYWRPTSKRSQIRDLAADRRHGRVDAGLSKVA